MKKIGLLLFLLSFLCSLRAQNEKYPTVGQPCPDFLLRNIKYYSIPKATLKDFKGKWLVLDFWNKSCGACIASFPKVSALQKEFGDKVQFMLVGIQDKEKQIEPLYARFREHENLIVPCAFDSVLANQFDIYTAPYIIVINELGVVQSISTSLNSADMREFLKGNVPRLAKAYRVHEEEVVDSLVPYNPKKHFLVNGNGGIDSVFLFRSIFTIFDYFKQHASVPRSIEGDIYKGRFQVLGVPLEVLYNYAYYGISRPDSGYNSRAILEVENQTLFQYSYSHNENLFCYSLTVPESKANKEDMEFIMRRDLENYFGYTAAVEERKFPCFRLVATESAKEQLRTKGEARRFKFTVPKIEFIAQNFSIDDLLRILRNFSGKDIIDGSGITGNIDIHINCILNDINDVSRELRNHGLDLVPDERVKKVLVIRDKPVLSLSAN